MIGEVGIEEELDLIGVPHIGGPADKDKKIDLKPGKRATQQSHSDLSVVGASAARTAQCAATEAARSEERQCVVHRRSERGSRHLDFDPLAGKLPCLTSPDIHKPRGQRKRPRSHTCR